MLWLVERRLRSANPSRRKEAVERLCAAGNKRASKAFQRALNHWNPDVRCAAVGGLCKVADHGSVPALLKTLLTDSHAEVLKTAAVALRTQPTREVQNALAQLLRHRDAGVRGTAARVLIGLHWQPSTPEAHAWLLVARGYFGSAANEHGKVAIAPLQLVIEHGPYDLSVRAVEALGSIQSSGVAPILLRALKSEHPGVCTAAVDALGAIGGPQIVESLLAMLEHPNVHVRVTAAEVMGRSRVNEAVGTLVKMTRDREWDVRRAAVEALGRIRQRKSLRALIASLDDNDPDVREAAARALGNLRERRSIGPLVLTLCDRETSVRRIAAASLSRIAEDWGGSPEAFATVDQLKVFLQDGDQEVRRRATDLLASLMAAQQSRSINRIENAQLALTVFIEVIRDSDPDLRLAAAEALARLADPEARPALEQALNDSDPNVRTAAERGLVLLGLKSPEALSVT